MKIENSIALVTGANRGIGRALVESLLENGAARIYATARRLDDLQAVVKRDPNRVTPLQLDVTNAAEVARVAALAEDVSLLFNNAGVLDFGNVLEAPPEAFQRNLDVNFYGALNMTRALAPALIRNHGSVVNVLSVVSFASMPGIGGYSASKAALWSLTQSLRADLSKRGVQVIGVFPGPVDTDMARGFELSKTSPQQVAREVLAGIEAGVEDIFPDPMSKQVYGAWSANHKAIEKQFAAM